jgi:hypothetical protein
MNLPFTVDQFLSVFVAYNSSIWPMQILLNIIACTAIVLCFRPAVPSRFISGLLGTLWIWTGVVYHGLFFSVINPVARLFALFFVIQGILFFTFGTIRNTIDFRFTRTWRGYTGAVFFLYALVLYPLIGQALGRVFPASPSFGAPCPTTIFTFGLLLWTVGRLNWYIYILPFLWSILGFTAALQLGIREDIGLLGAGVGGTIILRFAATIDNQ